MSLSVNGSNTNNPYAYLQSLLQQGSSPSNSAAQPDPLSALLTALGQQGAAAAASASGGTSSSSGATAASGSSSPQFGPQTLQALFALQANGANWQSAVSQLDGAGAPSGTDPTSAPQSQQTQGQHGHRHHHHMDGAGQSPLDMLTLADSGATSQTATNANGSTTTTITYADGSTVTMTTAAPTAGSGSSGSLSSTAGGANVASNNLLEQLIQMQAQLLNPATTQSVATV